MAGLLSVGVGRDSDITLENLCEISIVFESERFGNLIDEAICPQQLLCLFDLADIDVSDEVLPDFLFEIGAQIVLRNADMLGNGGKLDGMREVRVNIGEYAAAIDWRRTNER